MSRFQGPLWRVAGSFVSWFVFTLSFSLLYLGASAVMGLGGYCASGGPYVIETPCPDAVVVYVPLSIWVGLGSVLLGGVFAKGFGAPLLSWAWPVLFVGLGIAFLLAALQPGAWSFLICAVLFLAMGGVPLWLELRADPAHLFLGHTNAFDVPFARNERDRGVPFRMPTRTDGDAEPIAATAGDWALSLGILAAAVALGVYVANLLYAAAGG